jgi:nucleotidyltransferase substrate binding protein (TIGR01987 family)
MTKHNKPKVTVEELTKAHERLEKFSRKQNSMQEQMIIVKAFEVCYELAWILIEKAVLDEGICVNFPSNIFVEAAKCKLIKRPQIWFGFLAKRNKISHCRDTETVEEIIEIIPTFKKEMEDLIMVLKKEYEKAN